MTGNFVPRQRQILVILLVCTVGFFLQQSVSSLHVERSPFLEVVPRKYLSTRCSATTGTSSSSSSSSSSDVQQRPGRRNQIYSLMNWAKMNGVKVREGVSVEEMPWRGLGITLSTSQSTKMGDVIIEVPTQMALSVDVPRDSPTNLWISQLFENKLSSGKNAYLEAPWWVRLSLQLVALKNNVCSINNGINKPDMSAWIETLPQSFTTPFHWSEESMKNLQYQFMEDAVRSQRNDWRDQYDAVVQGLKAAAQDSTSSTSSSSSQLSLISYQDFVWGCECARSRAFSGTYSGSPFTPAPYIFTLLFVTIYVGFNLGTLEQASNGAALVLCATIFKDFIIPKFLKQKRYVICPVIDMANHASSQLNNSIFADVALEYLRNSYSLSITHNVQNDYMNNAEQKEQKREVYISYGPRSNDQLLQYFGFVEIDNPHDIYVMPPLRQWDIDALETACGRTFGSDRLIKLEQAGLLGVSDSAKYKGRVTNRMDTDEGLNPSRMASGGVILSRATGIDPAIQQALRALVSTDEEWENAGRSIGSFATQVSPQNERLARIATTVAIQMELKGKPTTLDQDIDMLNSWNKQQNTSGSPQSKVGREMIRNASNGGTEEDRLALLFRIEKKKLLCEILAGLDKN